METEIVCFPAPLNACFPLSYGNPMPAVETGDDDGLEALTELASSDCYICKLDELFPEDWE